MDDILKILEERIKTCMSIQQEKNFQGVIHKFKPAHIEMCHKSHTTKSISAFNGGITQEFIDQPVKAAGIRVGVGMGDTENGLGFSHSYEDSLPLKPEFMNKSLAEPIDFALKDSFKTYFDIHSNQIHYSDEFFDRLSKEPPQVSIEGEQDVPVNGELKEFIRKISEEFSSLSFTHNSTALFKSDITCMRYINSEGSKIRTYHATNIIGINVNICAEDDGRIIEYNDYVYFNSDMSNFNPEKIKKKITYIKKILNKLYKSRVQPSGSYPVILSPRGTGHFFHENIAAHLLSARYIIENVSTAYRDKMGEQILPEDLTIINDPTKPGNGHYTFDEEGVPSQRIVLVEDGILKNYLHTRITAGHMGVKSNGCARSGSVCTPPEPRIANLEINAKDRLSMDELIHTMLVNCESKGLEYGLLVDTAGGEVDPKSTSFKMFPRTIWRIYPDYKRELVSSAYLIGDSFGAASKIAAFGGDIEKSQGLCGAESGTVRIEQYSPSSLVIGCSVQQEASDKPTQMLTD